MSDPNEKKYKQLALFSTIVAEMVVTPSVLGGGVYFLLKGKELQMILAAVGAFLGLGIAIYRIFQMVKIQSRDDSHE